MEATVASPIYNLSLTKRDTKENKVLKYPHMRMLHAVLLVPTDSKPYCFVVIIIIIVNIKDVLLIIIDIGLTLIIFFS